MKLVSENKADEDTLKGVMDAYGDAHTLDPIAYGDNFDAELDAWEDEPGDEEFEELGAQEMQLQT